MTNVTPPFEFDYDPGTIIYGRGCVDRLGTVLESRGFERALIVCGSNVGSNSGVMDPVTAGLGSTLVDVFDETTPAKYIQTAADGAERIREDEIDVLVCLGGGSSLDVAKVMCLVAAHDRSFESILEEIEETGTVPNPEEGTAIPSTVVVPTTLAGADMSSGGGIKLTDQPAGEPPLDDEVRSARFGDPRLTPEALFYDPALFETTPDSVLVGSAINGFDKGIETLYSGSLSPITDSTAIRGLKLLRASVGALDSADRSDADLDRIVTGIILVQYGRQTSIIHAFGHGLSFYYPVQQGEAHGILAPHVLRYVFDRVDARRELIAEGLGVDPTGRSDDELAEAIIDAVIEIRETLDLPSRLRGLEGVERDHLPAIAAAIAADQNLERNPPGLDPDVDDIEAVLKNAW
ncbi:iron-containing alcohol dehydrogenase family protein [Natronorubrum sp. FCH18a]|uniref:iron-containing alcohol dehydrogenase family protein n=1 Tax=Natronorubrum sp. FCH18a TaxID=3447018 RepID=UPI003F51109A